jgi:hypothetical protein
MLDAKVNQVKPMPSTAGVCGNKSCVALKKKEADCASDWDVFSRIDSQNHKVGDCQNKPLPQNEPPLARSWWEGCI